MPIHTETRQFPYSSEQIFDLVADVEKYPEFLPWCLECTVVKRTDKLIVANLVVGYKLIREWFGSKVTLDRPNSIKVEYVNGPLRYLKNSWKFTSNKDGSCTVDFHVDFEFKSPFLEKMMGMFFNEIVKRMVAAFEARAVKLYQNEDFLLSPEE